MHEPSLKDTLNPDLSTATVNAPSALARLGQAAAEKLSTTAVQFRGQCHTWQEANYDSVIRRPGSILAVVALLGVAVGYLLARPPSK